MKLPLSLQIAWRYTRAKRRNHFISFISLSSICGVALGVMALITVLSVMNGFEKELKERILGMVPHARVFGAYQPIRDWKSVITQVKQNKEVIGAAPFIHGQGMIADDGAVKGVHIEGILPEYEDEVTKVSQSFVEGSLTDLKSGSYNIAIGESLASSLGAKVGDKITLIIPEANVSPAGVLPRFKRFTVAGIFKIGYQYDSILGLVHLEDAAKLYRFHDAVTGVELKFTELYAAPRLAKALGQTLSQSKPYIVRDWTREHGNYFEAVKLEKTIMFAMLLLIIAVAAFNIVSTLVMVVTDKQSEIAILRTIGGDAGLIMKVFILQGGMIGLIGTTLGVVFGILLALNVTDLVAALEAALKVQFLSSDVYYISFLPSDLQMADVVKIAIVAVIMSLLATIYPAWKASKIQPAECLRYE